MQITYKHTNNTNTASIITTTPINNKVLYHIQLSLSELDDMGIAWYETDHKSYTPTWEELGWNPPTFSNKP